jgi:hypothetical protein
MYLVLSTFISRPTSILASTGLALIRTNVSGENPKQTRNAVQFVTFYVLLRKYKPSNVPEVQRNNKELLCSQRRKL